MKFLFVGTHDENTGAATHFIALAQALSESGHEVDALLNIDGLIWKGLAYSGVRRFEACFRNAFDPRGYAAVIAAIRRRRPDWLVGNFGKEYWPLVLVGRALGIPVTLFRHRTPRMKWLSALLLPRLAHRFFAVSWHARQAYLAQGIPGHRVRVLYNPVNMALYRPDATLGSHLRDELGIPREAVVLGYVGRMHGGKGIAPLLAATQQAMVADRRLHCVWIGDGPDAGAIRDAIAAYNDTSSRHHVLGWRDDAQRWYSAFSMLAFPSIALETFGRVSVEAQATGVPVLASAIGGVPETLFPDRTGLLLPPGDIPAWRDAIVRMCDDEARMALAQASREFVLQHFSTTVIAADFVRQLQLRDTVQPSMAAQIDSLTPAAGSASPHAASRISGTRRRRRSRWR